MHISTTRLALVSAVLSTAAFAQSGRLLFQRFATGSGSAYGGYGGAVCTVGDINGDGWDDIAVGHSTYQAAAGSGRVQLLSGLDGALIRDCASALVSGVGLAVAAPGDVNGDQVPDVLSLSGAGYGAPLREIQLFSGADGTVLLPLAVNASAIAGPGDWNNDMVPDIAYVLSGVLTVVSGSNGSLIATPGNADAIAAIGDSQPGTQRLAALLAGAVTLHPSNGPAVWTVTGYQRIAAAGDLDSDLLGDVLAVTTGGTSVDVLSGANGSVLLTAPVTGSDALAGGVDLDGDTLVDFVTGEASARGIVRAYSGASGSLLFEREGQEVGESFGAAIAMHPGAGQPQRPAVLVGAPYRFDGSVEIGALQVVAEAQVGEFDGSFRPFGQLCNFTTTRIRPGATLPTIGQSYGFRFDNNTTPVGFELLAYGTSNATWNGIPLPVVLPGVLSCQLFTSAEFLVTSNPFSSFASLAIPLNAGLAGYTLHVQGFNVTGFPIIEASDAATIVIGN